MQNRLMRCSAVDITCKPACLIQHCSLSIYVVHPDRENRPEQTIVHREGTQGGPKQQATDFFAGFSCSHALTRDLPLQIGSAAQRSHLNIKGCASISYTPLRVCQPPSVLSTLYVAFLRDPVTTRSVCPSNIAWTTYISSLYTYPRDHLIHTVKQHSTSFSDPKRSSLPGAHSKTGKRSEQDLLLSSSLTRLDSSGAKARSEV